MRLNKFLAHKLGISRRSADDLIINNKVIINGQKADLGRFLQEEDKVEVCKFNKWITLVFDTEKTETILFYKPIFCVTLKFDPNKRKTVYNFLPKDFHKLTVLTKLDYMSEGLVLLSNDSSLIKKFSDPSYSAKKTYFISLKKDIDQNLIDKLKTELGGPALGGFNFQILKQSEKDSYQFLKLQYNACWYKIEIIEGKSSQLKNIFELIGHPIHRFIKVKQGIYEITKDLYEQRVISL